MKSWKRRRREMTEQEYLNEWAEDVLKWVDKKLGEGKIDEVQEKLGDVVTALIVATRPEYREVVLSIIKKLLKVVEIVMRRGVM